MESKLILDSGKIKQLRKAHGLSQEKLAQLCEEKRLRISIATIKRAELSKPVSLRTVKEFAQAFDVEMKELLSPSEASLTKAVVPSTMPHYLPILWLQTSQWQQAQSARRIICQGDCIAIEQLGNSLVAIFNQYGPHGKGIVQAQKVALELKAKLCGKAQDAHLHIAVTIGEANKSNGQMSAGLACLQWFAQTAPTINNNSIVVSEPLFNLTQERFTYSKNGEHWELISAGEAQPMPPMAGRATELLQLNAILDSLRQHPYASITNITGVLGIGKSRLLQSVIEQGRLRKMLIAHLELEGEHSRVTSNFALDICHQLYCEACHRWGSRVEKKLKSLKYRDEVSNALVAEIIAGASGLFEGQGTNNFPINELACVTADILNLLISLENCPIMIVVDNIHLIDEFGVAYISNVVQRCQNRPVIIISASRTDSASIQNINQLALDGHRLNTISLPALSQSECQVLSEDFPQLNQQTIQACQALADGIPLYLTQLLAARVKAPLSGQIPESLQVLVKQKQQDLTEPAYCLLNLLCVHHKTLSELFCCELMQKIMGENYSATLVANAIAQLCHRQLIKRDNINQIGVSQKLVKAVIYNTIHRQERESYHLMLAQSFEQSPNADEYALDIAIHYELGEQKFKAQQARYLYASQLVQQSQYPQALTELNKALLKLKECDDPQRLDLEIDIQLSICSIYKVQYGWVSPFLKSAYLGVTAIFENKAPDPRYAMALFGLWAMELATMNYAAAEQLAYQCLETSKAINDPLGEMHAHVALSNSLFWRGKHIDAEASARKAIELYRDDYYCSSIQLLGQDPRAFASCFGALSASLLGQQKEVNFHRKILNEMADEAKHEFSRAIALQGIAWLEYHQGHPKQALRSALELEALSNEMNFPFYRGVASLFVGWANHKLKPNREWAKDIEYGYQFWIASSSDKIAYSLYCCIISEVLIDTGQKQRAKAILTEGLELAEARGEHCYNAEIHRLLALCNENNVTKIHAKAGRKAMATPLIIKRIREAEPQIN